MTVFKLERQVKAHADVVWAVISDVEAFAEVAPNIRKVELLKSDDDTKRRRCYDYRDKSWTESSVEWVEGQHYVMEVDTTDYTYPFHSMRSTYSMQEKDDGVLISIRYDYRPKYGIFGFLADRLYARRKFFRVSSGLMDNWVARIRDREWGYKVTVNTILRRKGADVATVPTDATMAEAAAILRERRIGCVLVMGDGADADVVGLVSERDIVRGVAEYGSEALVRPVTDVMARKLIVCSPDNDMFFVMACMTDRRIRHLPVIDAGRLVGIISIGDVIKERIYSLESESETMREYIAGREWRYHHHLGTGVHDVKDIRGELSHL